MENQKRLEISRKVLVLVAVIGLVLFSWLLGHIVRYSIPALWHPPIRETDPQLRYGVEFEFDGIRRQVVLTKGAPVKEKLEIYLPPLEITLSGKCLGYTYFTSLPAKCLGADGSLVRVGGPESDVNLIPQGK